MMLLCVVFWGNTRTIRLCLFMCRPYFVFGSSLGMAHVRPILGNLVPAPSPLVAKILQEVHCACTPVHVTDIAVATSRLPAGKVGC